MSNDNMGNLEKLGILVIVILVVVVGVVAITPHDTLFPGSDDGLDTTAELEFERVDDETPARDRNGDAAERDRREKWPIDLDDELADDRDIDVDDADRERRDDRVSVDPEPPYTPPYVPPTPPAPDPKPAVRPVPGFRTVVVRPDDSFYAIAERELGRASRWREIAALNSSVDPRRIKAGDSLRIPTSDPSHAGHDSPRIKKAPRDGERSYVVKSGETLSELSTKFYGTSRHWKHLLKANGMSAANDLQSGMTLRVPPAPVESSNAAAPVGGVPARTSARSAAGSGDGRRYLVKPGETLMDIAREHLGKSSRWREILELNGLADARDLRSGATIRLPQ